MILGRHERSSSYAKGLGFARDAPLDSFLDRPTARWTRESHECHPENDRYDLWDRVLSRLNKIGLQVKSGKEGAKIQSARTISIEVHVYVSASHSFYSFMLFR